MKRKDIKQINNASIVLIGLGDVNLNDEILLKGNRITQFGRVAKVTRIMPKTVEVEVTDIFYPIFDHTAFGRVAKGETIDLEYFQEIRNVQIGEKFRFRKNGLGVGNILKPCKEI